MMRTAPCPGYAPHVGPRGFPVGPPPKPHHSVNAPDP